MSENIRRIAVGLLEEIEEKGAYSQEVLLQKLPLIKDERDKKFLVEIIYGVLRRNITILHIIQGFSKKPLYVTPSQILRIIKVGAYQLLFLDKIPPYAAVNEAVEHAKLIAGKKGGSFVNAILRKISSEGKGVISSAKQDSVKYSLPLWLLDELKKIFPDDYESLFEFFYKPSFLTFRVNTLKISRELLISKFERDGINSEPTKLSPYGIKVRGGKVFESRAFEEGFIIPQDEGSQLVVEIMAPQSGSCVLELCCGNGVKTTQIAQIMNNKGRIFACDINEKRIKSLKELLLKCAVTIVEPYVWDIFAPPSPFSGEFDSVLIDAPCTGSGTIARRPELRMRIEEGNIYKLSSIQKQMLLCADRFVKKGGYLTYAVCSIFPEEGIEVIEHFLKRNPHTYEIVPLKIKDIEDYKGFIFIKPHIHQCDGFFIAKMKKVGG